MGDPKWEDVVLEKDWWWAVQICLSVIALLGNVLFIITIIYNRKRHDLKTFVTSVMITIAVLDISDVGRILPVLSEDVFGENIFQRVYCTLGVFHELTVAIFLVSMAIAVCVQAGIEQKYYGGGNNPTASLAQKIFIPLALLVGAGISIPLGVPDLLKNSYAKLDHHCTDWTRVKNLWKTIANGTDTGTDEFHSDLYSTVVAAFTYIIPVLVLPIVLPFASLRTCISRQCCVPRYKQPIGELVMTTMICIIYLGTVVGVVLPRLDNLIDPNEDFIKLGPAPLLWELANNAARPLCYFMANPGVWDGIKTMCGCSCKKKHQLVSNDDMEEAELPLAPVTTV
jgi:hypothetical protein